MKFVLLTAGRNKTTPCNYIVCSQTDAGEGKGQILRGREGEDDGRDAQKSYDIFGTHTHTFGGTYKKKKDALREQMYSVRQGK